MLNDGTVHHRIRERNADLEQVGAGIDDTAQHVRERFGRRKAAR